ncbi:putative ATP-dependent RNA helicase domain protein [Burkholderia pseudomallei]|nr:putative ATP-dependent RNA helicase domain protein [Burkholderia pseudomallei]
MCSRIRCVSSSRLRSRSTGWIFCAIVSAVVLRRATSISAGESSRLSASDLISSEKVAENSRFWRFAGSFASTRLMSWMKPMSSIRSASSSTRMSRLDTSIVFCCMWSSRRPGVATTMSTPRFNASICGLMLTPPNITVERSFTYLLYARTLSSTCAASSRVGVRMSARTARRALRFSA